MLQSIYSMLGHHTGVSRRCLPGISSALLLAKVPSQMKVKDSAAWYGKSKKALCLD